MFNVGTDHAFFTFSSKKTETGLMLKVYSIYVLLELLLIILFIVSTKVLNVFQIVFPDQILFYVITISFVEWLNFVTLILIRLGEAKAETVLVQKVNLWSLLFKIALLVFLYFLGKLTLDSFITINILTLLISSIFIYKNLIVSKYDKYFRISKSETLKEIKKYFLSYNSPLVIFTIVTFVFTFFERWFLQLISGSVQQAYFSIAFQWNSLSLLFTTSILNIFWREISSSFGRKDITRIKNIFPKTIKLVFFISSLFAIFFVFNAEFLLSFFAGDKFVGATNTLIVFSFIPVFQSIGQLTSSYFLATEQTVKFRNLGLVSLITGIIATYFMLAPNNFVLPGLELGAEGLAIKTVVLTIIFTNIYLFIIAKQLSIKFKRFIEMQITSLLLTCVLGIICFVIISEFFETKTLLNFTISSIIYLILSLVTIYKWPSIVGLDKTFIETSVNKIKYTIINK